MGELCADMTKGGKREGRKKEGDSSAPPCEEGRLGCQSERVAPPVSGGWIFCLLAMMD